MPKINVYLPDDLAEAVKAAGVPVSAVCQRALEQAVRRITAIREIAMTDLNDDDLERRLPSFTARARQVLAGAIRAARDSDFAVGTGHLLAAMIDEGNNMALHVLRAVDVDPATVADDLRRRSLVEPGHAATDNAFSTAAGTALELTVAEATALGHNYIGCEHLLLGLVADTDGVAGQVLRGRGAELRTTRRAVVAGLAMFVHARTQAPQAAAGPARTVIAEILRAELQPLVDRIERLERKTGIEPE
jgi:ATP-dependent Clp protease ATP-binding subunit ClpC